MQKAIFFDRDGTLIYDKIYLNDPDGVEYLPGVFQGLRRLKKVGYKFLVVTNQSGIPRGLVQEENLHKIHERIQNDLQDQDLNIERFYYAPHLVESNHPLRNRSQG